MDAEKRIRELEWQVTLLEHDLIHDPLTGLKTRHYLEEELERNLNAIFTEGSVQRREKFGYKNLSVLFLDIDHFKKINDTFGHEAGDKVLQSVANTIKEKLRSGDTVARWGGEEIVAELLGATEDGAEKKAEEIRQAVENLKFYEKELKVTISCGIASAEKGISPRELIHRSDQALYAAKNSGRNQVVTYSILPDVS